MINLIEIVLKTFKESTTIILIIFALMILVEFLVLKYQQKITKIISKKSFLSYIIASIFGSIPGCIGTFAMDTLYMSGLLGFGGLISAMIATSGDEAFMMISMAITGEIQPITILTLIIVLFLVGIIGGYLADKIKKKYNWKECEKCRITYHKEEFKVKHFFKVHIYQHIIKKHLWQIFLWLFATLFIIEIISQNLVIDNLFSGSGKIVIFLIAALFGLLPISGPNVVLIVLFAQGAIPFSILLTNSIIQDGHGLLPIIGFSLDDALKIKLFNFIFGIIVGGTLLLIGF